MGPTPLALLGSVLGRKAMSSVPSTYWCGLLNKKLLGPRGVRQKLDACRTRGGTSWSGSGPHLLSEQPTARLLPFHLLHVTLYCTPSLKSHSFTPLAWLVTVLLRNVNKRKPLQVESMVWCSSWGIFPNSCHCYAGACPSRPQHNHVLEKLLSRLRIVWAELNWLHFSMWNKHAAELDVVWQERYPTSGTTSRTPNLIN